MRFVLAAAVPTSAQTSVEPIRIASSTRFRAPPAADAAARFFRNRAILKRLYSELLMPLSQSHDTGRTDVPLIEDTIGRHFEVMARRFPQREALVSRHQGQRFT